MHWVTAHVHAFEWLAGCPPIVVCDNLRSGVTRPHRYEPDVNATYQEMAAHYGVAIVPARPYKPRDKAKVEAGVLLAERWIMARLRNQRFTAWPRPTWRSPSSSSGSTPGRSRRCPAAGGALRDLDRPALRPLPASPLRVRHLAEGQGQHRLPRRGRADRHYYSVPYRLVGKSSRCA